MTKLLPTLSKTSISLQEGEEILATPATKKSETGIKYDDIYITPGHIKFSEAFEGVIHRERITIKNVGNKPALIKILQPNSMSFQVKVLKNVMRVSPGLSITTSVIYSFKRPALLDAIIPIEINGKRFDYCVTCVLATGCISIEPKTIDFGILDIGYWSGFKIITIHNEGNKSTRFSIDLGRNDLDITVKPLRGIVRPQKEVKLRIELMGKTEGIFYSEFWIKSMPNIRIPIKANIIIPRFVVYHPNTVGDFTLIDFPSTVENTSRYTTFVLRNLSSRVSSYVVLGELDNEVKCIRDIDFKHYPTYSAFEVHPFEGRLDPFQSIIFEVKFSPMSKLLQWKQERKKKQWTKRGNRDQSQDFMAFIRIVRVHCTESEDIIRIDPLKDNITNKISSQKIYIQETMIDTSSLSTSCASSTDLRARDVIRFCLYGEVEMVRLHIEPDIFYFGDLIVGQTSQRVLRLTNCSAIATIYLQSVSNAAVRCYPHWMKLTPKASIEVLVKVHGKESIKPSFKLFFDVLANSYDFTPSKRFEKVKVGSYFVKCMVNIIFKSKNQLLSKRSLLISTISNDEEIMKRLLRLPKYKLHTSYSDALNKFTKCVKRFPLEKSISTTKAAVLIPLSPMQIYNIHIYPTTFAFGMVAPNSLNYRRLVAKNTNNVPVMIRLISLSIKYIRFPEGNLMILQPDSMMTKLIEYYADEIGKFNGYIDYVINDNHSFELNITADIVHKYLYIDKKEIEFGKEWSNEEAYRPMASAVQITNKLSAKVCFRWEVPKTCGFYVEPLSGSVRGNCTSYVYMYYESDHAKINHAQVIMKCESGSCVSLQLSLPRFIPKVEFVNNDVNLGEISLNLPTKAIAVLQNFEFNEVVYEVDSASLINGCIVDPLRGKISPRGIGILEVCLTFEVCCHFSIAITVMIQGRLRLHYRIHGIVSFPRLKILPQRIDMKRISIDAFQTHRITATNIGTTMLKLQFLLEEYPEFRVSLSEDNKNSDIGTEDIIIVPDASRSFYLHFQPVDLASYAFYLPMVINHLLGPVSMMNPKSVKPSEFLKSHENYYANLSGFIITPLPGKLPTVSIDCTVAGSIVFFSKLLFQFNTATNELSEELFIENRITLRDITVLINIEKFSEVDCPFTIEWSRGAEIRRTFDSIECTLCPGGNVFFVLEFKPKKRGSFSIEAPIYVRGELEDGMFNKLRLYGEFPASSIDIEPTEIYFVPVPLGTAIEEKFRIRARHFDNVAFIRPKFSTTSRCCGDYKDELLRVEFPNGNIVSPQSDVEFEARITFKSDQPISFCSTIEFCDDHVFAVCFLTVYATADNCLLSTYMYSIKSCIFDDTYAGNLEKRVLYLSTSSDNETDEDDWIYEGVLRTHRHTGLIKSKINVGKASHDRRSIIKTIDAKLRANEEMKADYAGIDDKNGQIDEKWATGDNNKQTSILERHSLFSINSETVHRKYSKRLLHSNDQNGNVEDHVQKIMTVVEQWMYSKPLKFHFYPNITYGITAAFSNFCVKKKLNVGNSKRKSSAFIPSFIDVLQSLVGSDIRNYLGELWRQPSFENDIERISYVLKLYDKMLEFLLSRGACLYHVSAQFLLNYNDYIISIDIIQSNTQRKKSSNTNCKQSEQLSPKSFESRNKQYWLDVILETYKCFVFRGIHKHKFQTLPSFNSYSSRRFTMPLESIVSSISSILKQYKPHEKAIQSISISSSAEFTSGNRCPEEVFLLSWLQYHYEQQRTHNWMTDRRVILNPREKQDVAEHREIQNFHYDLSDGLVLIAVTVAYCPFLVDEYFSNLYICPRNRKEVLHNAICLVTAWRKIRLGFIITPMQLINPNQVQMLMLVVHLFQVLPTYVPGVKIKFNCSLSQTVTKQISISNPTDSTVNYLLSFVCNVNRFFTVLKPVTVLRLNAHGNGQVHIQFHAKKIQKSKAYLLLCGNAIGTHFGTNQTIVLEGYIDNLGIANEYTIRSKLYEIVETSLRIKIPYRNAAEYDIWITEEQPSHPSLLKMSRWCELRTRKIPRRLFINQKSLIVPEGVSEAHLSISVACIAPEKRTFWLIFQAKTGDFIIEIDSIWQVSINDRIVVEWAIQEECFCSDLQNGIRDTCPFNINIPIPSRNIQFWKCVTEMFRKTLDLKERLFWSKYLGTYIELRLIRWLMGDYIDSAALEFVHIFNTTVTYKVTISDKSNTLVIPEYFTIQDVRPFNQQVPMIAHILPTTPLLYETTITFTSLDGKELRVYIINCLRS